VSRVSPNKSKQRSTAKRRQASNARTPSRALRGKANQVGSRRNPS
jgi:hypothetical protein